jgi:uncharacterized protein (DUF1778 family)
MSKRPKVRVTVSIPEAEYVLIANAAHVLGLTVPELIVEACIDRAKAIWKAERATAK